ncbi:MAG: TerB family tellurite resistance protein [Hyphomicrobiales bacterium]
MGIAKPRAKKDRDLILRAMVSMAVADGKFCEGETETVRHAYLDVAGKPITEKDVASAAKACQQESGSLVDELCACQTRLDRDTKETLLKACYKVLLADGRIAGRERKRLHDYANALKIPEIHLTAILEEV